MKPSEIFEGENSGLRKAFDEAVARQEFLIDQRKAEMDKYLKYMNNGMVISAHNMTTTEQRLEYTMYDLRGYWATETIKKEILSQLNTKLKIKIHQDLTFI